MEMKTHLLPLGATGGGLHLHRTKQHIGDWGGKNNHPTPSDEHPPEVLLGGGDWTDNPAGHCNTNPSMTEI